MRTRLIAVCIISMLCSLTAINLSCSPRSQQEGEGLLSYLDLKNTTDSKKSFWREQYNSFYDNKEKQDSILIQAQKYLLDIADNYFKAWYNTKWSFHGHTQIPKEGSIACGYFVTTTLRDMGFKIPRIKWAQQTSEYMIKKMTIDIKRFHNRPIEEIISYIKNKGEGLYVVGLDRHVGYIYNRNGKITFVHSNYYQPQIGVMSEPLIGRNPLTDSKYRVIGKILDKNMIRNWLLDIPYSE